MGVYTRLFRVTVYTGIRSEDKTLNGSLFRKRAQREAGVRGDQLSSGHYSTQQQWSLIKVDYKTEGKTEVGYDYIYCLPLAHRPTHGPCLYMFGTFW